jgi:hypothetical protein
MRTYGEVEVQLHEFLIVAVYADERLASSSGTHWIGPTANLDASVGIRIPIAQSVVSHYIEQTIPLLYF